MIRAVALVLALFAASPVAAQPDPGGRPPASSAAEAQPYEPPAKRPSGFWGTTKRAEGGAYRWKLLAIGIVLAGVTGIVMLRLVKRANAQRRTDL